MTNPMEAIKNQVEQARQAAEQITNQQAVAAGAVPAPYTGAPVAVAAAPAQRMTMGALQSLGGALNPDKWLAVKEFGLLIKPSGELIESIVVDIDPFKIAPCQAVKFGDGIYKKTYNMQQCTDGTPWQQAVATAANYPNKPGTPYKSVDIPMTLVNDVIGPKSKATLAAKGQTLGYSVATTGYAEFDNLWNELRRAGLITEDPITTQLTAAKVVRVELGFKPRTNAKGQTWGVVTFKLLGAAEA